MFGGIVKGCRAFQEGFLERLKLELIGLIPTMSQTPRLIKQIVQLSCFLEPRLYNWHKDLPSQPCKSSGCARWTPSRATPGSNTDRVSAWHGAAWLWSGFIIFGGAAKVLGTHASKIKSDGYLRRRWVNGRWFLVASGEGVSLIRASTLGEFRRLEENTGRVMSPWKHTVISFFIEWIYAVWSQLPI